MPSLGNRVQNLKCAECAAINFVDSPACRRCGAALPTAGHASDEAPARRSNRFLVVSATTLALLFVCRLSLVATSDPLDGVQQGAVTRAVILLERQGFASEVALLRHLASFRATDNWWNRYIGHQQAYAATNFPYEVVTLYPRFFEVAVDDNERAVILLHESHHLLGRSEEAALERVWRAKSRLGWNAETYGHTRVWKNTVEWTMSSLPHLFTCGGDGRSDCLE